MGRGTAIVAGIVVGAGFGAISALAAAGLLPWSVSRAKTIDIAGWQSDWTIGTEASDPYLRAWVARFGLLALRKSEAVYFISETDKDGLPLTETCHYQVTGGSMPGSWWSVTLYDTSGYLPLNNGDNLSFDATAVLDNETWAFTIAPETPADPKARWLSSANAGAFDLTLRIYEPDPAFLDNPTEQLTPPTITRLSCQEGA